MIVELAILKTMDNYKRLANDAKEEEISDIYMEDREQFSQLLVLIRKQEFASAQRKFRRMDTSQREELFYTDYSKIGIRTLYPTIFLRREEVQRVLCDFFDVEVRHPNKGRRHDDE
jgi:hypothetical protein|tara:strand:- start:1092 stop:1439 length:348 start_codon:yes stop_codon:yes gene_type:complete